MNSRKRSLFNRPTWVKASQGEDDDMFRRSKRTYDYVKKESSEVAAFYEDSANEKMPWVEGSVANLTSHHQDVRYQPPPGRAENLSGQLDLRKQEQGPMNARSSSSASPLSRYNSAIEEEKQSRTRKAINSPVDIVDLEASSHDAWAVDLEHSSDARIIPIGHDNGEKERSSEDEEFPELARFARERARRQRLEQTSVVLPSTTALDKGMPVDSAACPSVLAAVDAEPTVQILVTSNIANTQPLVLTRKLSQRLKEVRLAWMQHQRPQDVQQERIFLTWRGKRVFDVVSCKGLGIKAECSQGDAGVYENGHVHMVVMTQETYDTTRKARERHFNIDADHEDMVEAEQGKAGRASMQMRIILQSRSFEDCKLLVKSSTSLSKMLEAFRAANRIEADKDILLQFDGESLDPGKQVGDTELADLDHVEVYVK